MRKALPLIAIALALNGVPAQAVMEFEDPNFEERDIVAGLDFPTTVDWTPDGRMFIAEKRGVLKVLNPGATSAVTVLDISGIVGDNADRGMLGLAVDSAYSSNHYVYLLYSRDTGLIDDDPGPMVAQLARYTISDTNVVSGGTVLLGTHVPASGGCPDPSNTLDCIPSDSSTHSIGTVRSAPDGTLYVGAGDGADYGGVDMLALRSLNENSLAGKILHVDRNGNGLAGHPFCPADSDLTHVCAKLHSKGFRNPFRFQLRPGGAGIALGDVGWNTREELDLIPLSPGGKSYGWPCYEGTIQTPGYEDLPECEAEYAQPAGTHLGPAYDYPHDVSNAIMAGPVYTGTNYPAAYRNKLYIADYATQLVRMVSIGAQDQVTQVEAFAQWFNGVDLLQAPDGDLVWPNPWSGTIQKMVYAPDNRTPTAVASATPTSGPAPLQVQFDGDNSSDPDNDPLTYDWDFGDGSAHSSAANPSHTYSSPGNYTATLTVDDGLGRTDTETVAISAGNSPPNTPTISAPADESLYRGGATINLQGSASDPQQGALPASALSWEVILHHATHQHPLLDVSGTAQTSFQTYTDHDADSFYEITLTAEDAAGLTSSRTIQIRPETASFSLQSSPAGAPISYAGTNRTAPFSTQAAVGFQTSISAAQQFTQNGRTWEFDSWSDGGARLHNVTIPATPTALTATYRDVTPGQITIVKQTDPPGSTQQFDFTGDLGSFSLTGASGGNSRTVQVAPGTHSVSEALEPGWDLTLLTCDDGSSTSGQTATVEVDPGENVTCVFRNTKEGSITISKQSDPAGSTQQFDFAGDLGTFTLTGATGGNSRTSQVDPGSYSVTEGVEAGWQLTQLTCSDGSSTSGRTATIGVSPGENVTCVFRNTRDGSITIRKETDPGGSTQQFAFSASSPIGDFLLSDGQSNVVAVDPGSYSVTEAARVGWDLTELTCSDGSPTSGRTATIEVTGGENVTCTYRNRQEGTISIEKQTLPENAADQFDFTGTGPIGAFALADDQVRSFSLDPGSYTVTQAARAGWDLTGIVCSDRTTTSIGPVAVDLDAGEVVTCVFTGTQRGRITVRALRDPPATPPAGPFAFTGDAPLGSFELLDGQSHVAEVLPGTYAVVQAPAVGYSTASVGCDDANSTSSAADRAATIRLEAGEGVVCTFTMRSDGTAPGEQPGSGEQADGDPSNSFVVVAPPAGRRRSVTGTATDADGVSRVLVAVARRLGRPARCRWWSRKARGLASRLRPCGRPRWMLAKLDGTGDERSWRVRLGASLPPGRYRVVVLVVDGRGNRSTVRLTIRASATRSRSLRTAARTRSSSD